MSEFACLFVPKVIAILARVREWAWDFCCCGSLRACKCRLLLVRRDDELGLCSSCRDFFGGQLFVLLGDHLVIAIFINSSTNVV